MKACRLLIPLLLLAACGRPSQDGLAGKSATLDNAVSDPARRYFGLHFDFHASPDRSGGCSIGETLKEEDIRSICRELRPDFLQVDSKGHPGWASFPSRMGNSMPRFTGNPLQVWRQVTREEGVALYAHYSGVFDTRYKTLHPDESAKGPDGKPDKRAVRTNGSYAGYHVVYYVGEGEQYSDLIAKSALQSERMSDWMNGITPEATPAFFEKLAGK